MRSERRATRRGGEGAKRRNGETANGGRPLSRYEDDDEYEDENWLLAIDHCAAL